MLATIYSFGLKTVEVLTQLVIPFNPKARQIIEGRKEAIVSLRNQLANNTQPIIWLHCSSVGEYEQGRPVLEAFKKRYSGYKALISFYSPSGYNAVETDEIIDFKIYLPRDSASNARKLIGLCQPKLALFIKYEFWHFYLKELKHNGIPVFSVSAIFRPEQILF